MRGALALDPDFAAARALLASCYNNLGRAADAEREMRLTLRENSRLGERERAYFTSTFYNQTGQYDLAVPAWQTLLRLRPYDSTVKDGLADAYVHTRDLKSAVDLSRRAIKDAGVSVIVRANHVAYELIAGNIDEAQRAAAEVLQGFPRPPPVTFMYAALASELSGRREEAAQHYSQLEAVNASLAAYGRADLAFAEGRYDDAQRILDEGLAADLMKKDPEAAAAKWAMLAELDLAQGRTEDAIHAAEKAILGGSTSWRACGAVVLARAGRSEAAAAVARVLGEERSQEARILAKVIDAEVLAAAGKAEPALRALDEARAISDAWLVHRARARILELTGRHDDAARERALCAARHGEGALAFVDDWPTLRYR
jgi:tetratricopeptide (TPR) repeat protein